MCQNLAENIDFHGYLSTLKAANKPKNRPFKAKENAWNSETTLKDPFFLWRKKLYKLPINTVKVGQILWENLNLLGYLSTDHVRDEKGIL